MTPIEIKALRALERRLNAQAYDLLCEELSRLAVENERLQGENDSLRGQLSWAEDLAESWRKNAIQLMNDRADEEGGSPGLTMDGRLVVVPAASSQRAHA